MAGESRNLDRPKIRARQGSNLENSRQARHRGDVRFEFFRRRKQRRKLTRMSFAVKQHSLYDQRLADIALHDARHPSAERQSILRKSLNNDRLTMGKTLTESGLMV
jgi:hypothetical protein